MTVGLLFQAATRRRPECRCLPWTAWLALGTLGWIIAWGWLSQRVSADSCMANTRRAGDLMASRRRKSPGICRLRDSELSMTDQSDRRRDWEAILAFAQLSRGLCRVEFLGSPQMRAARMELEFLKPELTFQDEKHPLHDRGVRQHADRRAGSGAAAVGAGPGAAGRIARRRPYSSVAQAERLAAKSHHYETARKFARLVSESGRRSGQGDTDYHRRRAGHHGGRQSRGT